MYPAIVPSTGKRKAEGVTMLDCVALFSRTKMVIVALALAVGNSPRAAAEDCSFRWPLDRERAWFKNAQPAQGSRIPLGAGVELALKPRDEVAFDPPREKSTDKDSFGGVFELDLPAGGMYQITLSSGASIDIVQRGTPIAALESSSADGCPDVRKSIRFMLAAGRLRIQLSGAMSPNLKISISTVD